MRTIRHLIYREVLRAVGFVTVAFLALFSFFDFADQLGEIEDHAAHGYTLKHALLSVLLQMPNHLYDLLPITMLIGTIYVMARLAESSEFTILRTSGLGPLKALGTLLTLGIGFVAFTFFIGDYVAPAANRVATTIQARVMGDITIGSTGAWMKDRQGEHSYSVNVGTLKPDGTMREVQIFEFNAANSRIESISQAATAEFGQQAWELHDVRRRNFEHINGDVPSVKIETMADWSWPTSLSSDMIAAALLSPERMQTVDLFHYITHLKANGQSAQNYEIEFWRKVFYPLSCLVMMILALPFAYLHFRSGNIAGHVFVGVLVGISFFLLNNVFGFIGNLHSWLPWLAAATPGLIYSVLALSMFGWLVARQ